jgi:hypothetical protein
MHAVETIAHIDQFGNITLPKPLKVRNKNVRIIILLPEGEEMTDEEWMQSAAQNSVFEFLQDDDEDIYSLEDGRPLAQ